MNGAENLLTRTLPIWLLVRTASRKYMHALSSSTSQTMWKNTMHVQIVYPKERRKKNWLLSTKTWKFSTNLKSWKTLIKLSVVEFRYFKDPTILTAIRHNMKKKWKAYLKGPTESADLNKARSTEPQSEIIISD